MADNVNITPGTGKVVLADELTDGTLGAGVAQFVKLMDGTLDSANKHVIDSSGRSSVAINAGLPVAVSATTALSSNTSTPAFGIAGFNGAAALLVKTGPFVGTIQFQASYDNGTNWINCPLFDPSSFNSVATGQLFASDAFTNNYSFVLSGGATHVRVSVNSYTSGTCTVTMYASTVLPQPPNAWRDGSGDTSVALATLVAGVDAGSNVPRYVRVLTAPAATDYGLVTRDIATTTSLVLASAVTSPASASTAVQASPLTGLGSYRSLLIAARLNAATGGALDVYVQGSPDGGTTWFDLVHFPQMAAASGAKAYLATLSREANSGAAPVVVNTSDGTPVLAANTVVQGAWGDRLRYVFVAGASTSAGASQTIKISAST